MDKNVLQPLENNRVIMLVGDICECASEDTCDKLLRMNACNHDEITLILNSEGGSIEDMFMITDIMELIESPVKTIGLGAIMSAGLLIFMAGNKGRRLITKNTSFLSHRFWAGTRGDHEDLVSFNDYVKEIHEKIIQHYIKHTGLKKKVILRDLLKESNYWFSAKDAIKYKIADGIITSNKYK